MSYNWIFKSLTSKSINAGEAGFASVQPNYPNIFEWTTDNQVTFDTVAEGPLIITFNRPIIISKYRLLSRRGLRYMKGWNISISYDGTSFMTIDTKNEDLCKTSYDNNGGLDCGEFTDRMFPVPKMTIAKIKLSLSVPNSRGTYDLHINAFDVYGSTAINKQYSCKQQRKSIFYFAIFTTLINS